jgi:hypothetical protein
MTASGKCLASFALLCGMAAGPALAASSAASSAVGGSSASVGSISTSFEQSSNSSSKTTTAAEGDYRIIEVTEVAERPGFLRLTLRALTTGQDAETAATEFALVLPQAAVAQGRLAAGQVVSAHARPYGTEFASADTQQAFFLLLTDDWYRELRTNPVVL